MLPPDLTHFPSVLQHAFGNSHRLEASRPGSGLDAGGRRPHLRHEPDAARLSKEC